jgi:lysophospholipase L1-like esterase
MGAAPSPPPSLAKRAVFAVVALLGSVVLALVIAETVGQLFWRADYQLPFMTRMPDDLFDQRASRNVENDGIRYSYDADGFRARPALDADRTVLFVGDSFTEGRGVRDDATFAAAAERDLRARGIAARSLNAGVMGSGVARELRLLQRLLDRGVSPDAVVWQLFPDNDIDDDADDGGFSVAGDGLVVNDPPRPAPEIAFRDRWLNSNALGGSVLVRMLLTRPSVRMKFCNVREEDDYLLEQRLLEAARSAVADRGVPLVFVVVASDTVCPQAQANGPGYPYPRVKALVADLGTPWIDLCTVASGADDFGTRDRHYSVTGNQAVGAAIAGTLAPLLGAPSDHSISPADSDSSGSTLSPSAATPAVARP